MRTLKRLFQFISIYAVALGLLWGVKIVYGFSDYLIPPPLEVLQVAGQNGLIYVKAVLDTLAVAIAGHMVAIVLAIVAVAPIIFLFLGDGLASRLLIAAMICYFPLLLSFIGIFAQPVEEVEHFFRITGRINWRLELSIRTFENLDKITTVIVGSGTMALVGTIIAEFLAATNGIGYIIRKALYQSNLAKILVALFLIGLCSSLYLSFIETIGVWIKNRLRGEKTCLARASTP